MEQTLPSSIKNLSSEQLADFIDRIGELAPATFGLSVHMPEVTEVTRAFRKAKVTHETLKYGLHIEGLTLLQRCALFNWFNSVFCEEEKLLMPLCVLPDSLGWNLEEIRWYIFSVAPQLSNENLARAAEPIADKIWNIIEMVRDDAVLYNELPAGLQEYSDLESLKEKVEVCCIDLTCESIDPLELFQVLEHHGFLDDRNIFEFADFKRKILSSNLGFNAVKYGLPRPGALSYLERLQIFAFFKRFTSTASLLVCPLLEAPPDLDCFKQFCHLALNYPMESNLDAYTVHDKLTEYLKNVGLKLISSKVPCESLPAFVTEENGVHDISSFFQHVKDMLEPPRPKCAIDLFKAALFSNPDNNRCKHVTTRYVDYIHSMVFGQDQNVELVAEQIKKYFACYSYSGQSSCCGKTKLALAKKINKDTNRAVLNLYMNARRVSSWTLNCPEPGEKSKEFFESLADVGLYREMECILGRLLIWMRDKFLEPHGNFYVLREGYHPQGYSVDDDTLKFNVTDIVNGFGRYRYETFHEWKDELNYLKSIYVDATKQVRVLFSVNIDDAACLVDTQAKMIDSPKLSQSTISVFRLIRRILHTRKYEFWYCPFIFSDRDTRLANFPPILCPDPPSKRSIGFPSLELDVTPIPYILFKPFILYDTWNLFLPLYEHPVQQRNWLEYIESLEYYKNLGYIGRPIWGAMIKTAMEKNCPLNDTIDWVLSIAEMKMNNFDFERFPNVRPQEQMETMCAAMAVIGLTVGFNSIISVVHSDILVKRWMLVLTYYSGEGSPICARYFPEPMLAIAACAILKRHPKRVVEEFRKCVGKSLVTMGEPGEFVARFFVLLCFLSCKLPSRYVNNPLFLKKDQQLHRNVAPRNVLDFLKFLTHPDIEQRIDAAVLADFGKRTSAGLAKKPRIDVEESESKGKEKIDEIKEELNDDEEDAEMNLIDAAEQNEEVIAIRKILKGYVSFSQYLMTHVIVDDPHENLAFAMAHQAALNLPPKSGGVDFAIPVALLDGSLGSINVQVKNQLDMVSTEEFKMWNAKVCSRDIPSINILMNVYPNLTADPEPEQSSLDVKFVRCGGRDVLTIMIEGTAIPNFHGLYHDCATGRPFREDSPYHGIIQEAAMLVKSQIAYYDPHSSKQEENREEFFVEQNNLERALYWFRRE